MASPLNLTNLTPTDVGMPSIGGTNRTYKVLSGKGIRSLFSMGVGQFSPFPTGVEPQSGNTTGISSAADVHKDEIYDTSITSLVDYFKQFPSMKLDYADFAYLKNVGVYPNNRLIIARRFGGGVSNDLTAVSSSPLSTLISWVGEDADFIEIKYNEEWTAAEADFESVLNDIGEDVKASQDITQPNIGSLAKRAFDILPLPGFMEGLQYQVMKNMGLTDAGIGNSPLGNPNMIAEAMRRKTVDFKSGDSGLVAKFSVKMTVEYEQKFINGIDPTLVYMDIIQNALTFGTSDSAFKYSSAFGSGVTGIIRDLISGDIGAIFKALAGFVSSLLSAIGQLIDKFVDILITPEGKDTKEPNDKQLKIDIAAFLKEAFASTVGHVVSKYKVRLVGIANALTGSPSTPWHITIGNPKKPLFSSGDMLCSDVTLTLGKTLAFNDLPSSIKLDLNFTSARNLGAQEIFNRFNTGRGRSYVRLNKSFVEAPDAVFATSSKIEELYLTASQTNNAVSPVKVNTVNDPYLIDWKNENQGTDYLLWGGNPPAPITNTDNTNPDVQNSGGGNLSNQSGGGSASGLQGANVQTGGSASAADLGRTASVTGTASEAQQIRTELDQAFRNTTVANLTSADASLATQLSSTSPTQSGASGSTVANPDYQKLLDEKSLNDAKMLNLGLTPSTVSLPNQVNSPTTTTTKGYTYTYEIRGNNQRVIVRDASGKFIYNTGDFAYPGNKNKDILIADAKRAVGDS
jgi:hypothetical protein